MNHFWKSIVALCLVLISCEDAAELENKLDKLDQNDYFPLQVGNYWTMSSNYTRKVEGTVMIGGKEYIHVASDTEDFFYRKGNDGKIYRAFENGDEFVEFDLSAAVGESWTRGPGNAGFPFNTTVISKTETVTLGGHTFVNCYRFYFDVPSMADEEHTVWLAPGIGIVKMRAANGIPQSITLAKARINGVEFEF